MGQGPWKWERLGELHTRARPGNVIAMSFPFMRPSPTGRVFVVWLAVVVAAASCKSGGAGTDPAPVGAVASVEVLGATLVKVGDSYTYAATARRRDGTIIQLPVNWSILEAGRGVMTSGGTLTPSQSGVITVVATIDRVEWIVGVSAYDWVSLSQAGGSFLVLGADVEVTDKSGASEFPQLVIGCNGANSFFTLWVGFRNLVTASGAVEYAFDGGAISNDVWDESSAPHTLFHSGLSPERKAFATTLAQARSFHFTFSEFEGGAKTTTFRVTGLSALLQPLLNDCPLNYLTPLADAEANLLGPESLSDLPSLGTPAAEVESRAATRR